VRSEQLALTCECVGVAAPTSFVAITGWSAPGVQHGEDGVGLGSPHLKVPPPVELAEPVADWFCPYGHDARPRKWFTRHTSAPQAELPPPFYCSRRQRGQELRGRIAM